MKKLTPATENSNAPQKVFKSLEPMATTTISITDTITGDQLIKRLQAATKFIKELGSGLEYDVLIQIDKREERCESNAGTDDNKGADNKT